jgi:hypothetical protein
VAVAACHDAFDLPAVLSQPHAHIPQVRQAGDALEQGLWHMQDVATGSKGKCQLCCKTVSHMVEPLRVKAKLIAGTGNTTGHLGVHNSKCKCMASMMSDRD